MRIGLHLILSLCLLLPSIGTAADPFLDSFPTIEAEELHVLQLIQNEVGKPSDSATFTEASKALNEISKRLNNGLQSVVRKKGWHENIELRFQLVKSQDVNACAWTGANRKGTRRHYVFLTEQMLNVLSQNTEGKITSESVAKAIQELIPGVLAHECGHLINNIDPENSIARRFGGKHNPHISQAIEARTDAEAINILKEAGLRPTALHDSFEKLRQLEQSAAQSKRSLISTFLSSHPATDLRLLQQRLQVTADPFLFGAPERPISPITFNEDGLIREVSAAGKAESRVILSGKEGRADLFQLLRSSVLARIRRQAIQVEIDGAFHDFELLTSRLIPQLQKNPPTAAELETFQMLFGEMLIANNPAWKNSFALTELVSKVPALRTQSFLENVLRNKFSGQSWGRPAGTPNTLTTARILYDGSLGSDSLALFQKILGQPFIETVKFLRPWLVSAYQLDARRPHSPATTLMSYEKEHNWEALVSKLASQAKHPKEQLYLLDMALNGPVTDPLRLAESYLLSADLLQNRGSLSPSKRIRITRSNTELSNYLATLVTNRSPREEYLQFKRVAEKIWAKKGELGFLTFLEKSETLDWETIGKALGKDWATTQKQLSDAILEYLQSKKAGEFLKRFTGKLDGSLQFEIQRSFLPELIRRPDFQGLVKEHSSQLSIMFRNASTLTNLKPLQNEVFLELQKALNALHGKPLTIETIEPVISGAIKKHWNDSVFTDMYAWVSLSAARTHFHLQAAIASAIDSSRLSAPEKRRLLFEILIKPYFRYSDPVKMLLSTPGAIIQTFGRDYEWMRSSSPEQRQQILTVLRKNGVFQQYSQLISVLRSEGFASSDAAPLEEALLLTRELQSEAVKIRDIRTALRFGESVFGKPGSPLGASVNVQNPIRSTGLSELRQSWISKLNSFPLTLDQKLYAFESMTMAGASKESEEFFRSEILPDLLKKPSSPQSIKRIKDLLRYVEKNHIKDPQPPEPSDSILSFGKEKTLKPREFYDRFLGLRTRTELVRHFVIDPLSPSIPVDAAISQVETYMRAPTIARDEVLERLAWKVEPSKTPGRTKLTILGKIEAKKSTNWSLYSPSAIGEASTVIDFANDLDRGERIRLIRYMMDPSEGLPESLAEVIGAHVRARVEDELKAKKTTIAERQRRIDQLKSEWRTRFHAWAQYSHPAEKVVFLDAVLNTGQQPLASESGFPASIWADVTGAPMTETTRHYLENYLNSGAKAQRSPVIAYLLAVRDPASGDTDLPKVFEAFQTLGKKGSQLFSILNTFGDKASGQLAGAKEHAPPMSLFEIRTTIEQVLPKSLQAEIVDIETILGSASIKTVARVRMKDGRTMALQLRRADAEAQVKAHYERAERFLAEVEKGGGELPIAFFKNMLKGVNGQIRSELDLRNEVKNTHKGRQLIRELNARMSAKMNGWKFAVPEIDPRTGNLSQALLASIAPGASLQSTNWNQPGLSPQLGKEIRSWIAEGNLIGLFDVGFCHADPHAGNIFVDPVSKTITWIDWGQVVSLDQVQSRHSLANLIRGISDKNAALVVSSARNLSDQKGRSLPLVDELRIVSEIKKVLQKPGSDFGSSISGILEVLAKHQIDLDPQISFGALKNILYLSKEISPDSASTHVRQQVARVLASKPTLTLKTTAGACLRNAYTGLLHAVAR